MTKVSNQPSPSPCPYVRTVAAVKQTCLNVAQGVRNAFQDFMIQRSAMRQLGSEDYCHLQRCIRNEKYNPDDHRQCVNMVNYILDPRSGPPD